MTRKPRNRGLYYPGPGQNRTQAAGAPEPPVSPEAAARLTDAENALTAAHRGVKEAQTRYHEAQIAYDDALAQASEGDALVRLAIESGNKPTARARLHAQVCALHPAIVGYWPAPEPDEDFFHGRREEFGLALDFTPEDATTEFIESLAQALRTFTRTFRPKFNSKDSPRPGYSQAYTRGGVIHYRLKAALPGYGAWASEDTEQHAPLEVLLAAVPNQNFLAALAGHTSPHQFRLHTTASTTP